MGVGQCEGYGHNQKGNAETMNQGQLFQSLDNIMDLEGIQSKILLPSLEKCLCFLY